VSSHDSIIVAGSGATGLAAALAAATAGARVLVAERAADLGGTSALSGGRVWIPANGFPGNEADTVDAARTYLSGLFPAQYEHMTEAFLAHGPEMARFVEKHTPHRFAVCGTYPDYHPDRPGATTGGRCLDMEPVVKGDKRVRVPAGYVPMTQAEWERWRYPSRFDRDLLREREREGIRTSGVGLVSALLEGAERAGVTVRTSARVTDVTFGPDGRVVAATVGGSRVPARAVILATGGYDWDVGLRRSWHPAAQRATGAPPSNTGDGLRIACRAGAATDNLGQGWWMPMLAIPGESLDGEQYYRSLIRERAVPRQIMVNSAGQRFVDEASPYNDVGKAMHGRDADGCRNDPAFLVFDSGFLSRYPLPGVPFGGPAPGWVARSDSIRGLAERIGVDPDGLSRTVAAWNSGFDDDFHRGENPYDRYGGDPSVTPNPCFGPLDEPPFYAVRVLAGTIGTKGGPITSASGEVLSSSGDPVPGLYAVGNAAAFWTGDAYPAPGATLGIGMTFGYLAGLHAAAR
jgi:succinate dehydrogenase/fumarate reductase flavoprotein subunit